MPALFDGHAGDDPRTGKVRRRPALLLRLRPSTARAARQDDRIEVPNGIEQFHGVRHERKTGVEVGRSGQRLPEAAQSVPALVLLERHTENLGRPPLEIRQNTVAIEIEPGHRHRSEEHTSERQSLMRNSYAVFCLKKKNQKSDANT